MELYICIKDEMEQYLSGYAKFCRYGGHIVKLSQEIKVLAEKDTAIQVRILF
jgi:hypothetical protein